VLLNSAKPRFNHKKSIIFIPLPSAKNRLFVDFICKNPHFTCKNTHFICKNTHFTCKNPHFHIKNRHFICKTALKIPKIHLRTPRNPLYALFFLSSALPTALSNTYKESSLKAIEMDIYYLNAWVALFQFGMGIPLAPLVGAVNMKFVGDFIYMIECLECGEYFGGNLRRIG
jgi:hypothetical protein